jgi:hypothetical protein
MLTLGSFLKITEVAQIFELPFYTDIPMYCCISFDEVGWATFWAIFSANSSGHPVLDWSGSVLEHSLFFRQSI